MAQRTLLLDLDGTLWDSRLLYAEILARVSGGSVAELENRLASGATVVQLATERGISRSRFAREIGNSAAASLRLYDGALRTLNDLSDRATSMGVVTNLPGWLVTPLVQATGVAGYFEAIVTPRRGVPAKPRPHGILRALQEMGRKADMHTWLVGDGVADAAAAAAAGVRFAWASYGYEAAQPPGAESVLRSFGDVLRL